MEVSVCRAAFLFYIMSHPNPQGSPAPLPGSSTEHRVYHFRRLRGIIALLAVLIALENSVGVPALRLEYTTYGRKADAEHMNACRLISLYGEKRYVLRFRPLITFMQEPEFKISGWAWAKVMLLKDHLVSYATK